MNYTQEELESMTKAELTTLAEENSIVVKTSWTKAQIIEAILGGDTVAQFRRNQRLFDDRF